MIDAVFEVLDFETAYNLARKLPTLDEIKIAAILAALEVRGYDAEALAGFARGIVEKSSIDLGKVADTCGTGGDGSHSINVSTAVAIALSTIHPVAKHGNRAMSSRSGSADVLEALGVRIEMDEVVARRMIENTGFAFLFAPLYHKSFARVGAVRRELGIRTIFNVVGPLTNPANPIAQVVGVAEKGLLNTVAEALALLERRGVVVYGDGIDEVSPKGKTLVAVVDDGIDRLKLTPEDFGVERSKIVPCKSSRESARRVKAVFEGRGLQDDRNFIAINFSMALFALGYDDLRENVKIFDDKLESGEFNAKLEEIVCRSTSTSIL